jgi:hypothetical protein
MEERPGKVKSLIEADIVLLIPCALRPVPCAALQMYNETLIY